MNPFWKDIFREIWQSKARFFSLLVITMLGAATVVGIQATAIDMRDAADRSYKKNNLYDIQIKSPRGFTEADIDKLRETEGIDKVMPARIFDAYITARNQLQPIRTYTLPDGINNIGLLSGRLPENEHEIAVERRVLYEGGYRIGDGITLQLDGIGYFLPALEEFTISGVVSSPLYLTHERGNTTLGNGSLRYYACLHPDAYAIPFYTDIYLILGETRELHTVSEVYKNTVKEWKIRLEDSGESNWFYFTREDGIAFESYYQDSLRLDKVAFVFPLVFFLVAVLVSLTTMSRMVEEQRMQIGIYKALGYRPFAVMLKYLLYALLSGGIGGALGTVIGANLFPLIITDAYAHLYDMPPIETPVPLHLAAVAMGASVLSILTVTWITAAAAMKGEAANLMRPKTPKAGKRVFIEKIPFIWKNLGFIGKVTARNIFRYKRRFFMTAAGVTGCAALLLTAFGLRDSISSVTRMQFEEIINYDAQVYLREIVSNEQKDTLDALINTSHVYIREETADAKTDAGGFSASVLVPEHASLLNGFIRLMPAKKEKAAGEKTLDRDGVLVTEKLARAMQVSPGDCFTLTTGDGYSYIAQVSGVIENYVMHYIYMDADYYKDLFGKDFRPNSLLINGDFDAAELLKNGDVRAVSMIKNLRDNMNDSIDALEIVTVVLLVMACVLAFIVLFNLTSINITERMRELATIKVLGFQDRETAMYLYRENMAVTAIGIGFGLFCGIYLNRFVLATAEIDLLKFPTLVKTGSYFIAGVLSFLFALIVNAVTYRKLAGIDMVESLKSVE